MSSPAKARANRRNAARSTGPKSAAGKATVARNARRHGLSLPVLADPGVPREVDAFARRIAVSVAGAPVDAARHALACRIVEAMVDLRRVRIVKLPLVAALDADPKDFQSLAQLARLDRYERRAFSRRATAVREFDAALATPTTSS
jgi:hypothetical protein